MLPGFRFLFAAIVLSMAILVFGLGAAALLRAAHEEFASAPPWHATPETTFAQQGETTRPVLAMLRFEPPAAALKATEGGPALTATDDVPAAALPNEQAAIAPTPAEPESIATPKSEDSSPPEEAKSDIPVAEAPTQVETTTQAAAPPAATETNIAAVAPAVDETAPAMPEPASTPTLPKTERALTKIATLGGPHVSVEKKRPAKTIDRAAIRKRKHARRTIERRRLALRARPVLRAPVDPFAQPMLH